MPTMHRPLHVLDVYSGAGGFSSVFAELGARVTAVEADPVTAATWSLNVPGTVIVRRVADWLDETHPPLPVDIVVGGPPCQGFSTLARAEYRRCWLNGELATFARTVETVDPVLWLMEEVPTARNTDEYRAFTDRMCRAGWVVHADVLDAADHGTPQRRRRLVTIGCRSALGPKPADAPRHPAPTVRTAIGSLPPPETSRPWHHDRNRRYRFEGRIIPGPWRTDELHVAPRHAPEVTARYRSVPQGAYRVPPHDGRGGVDGRLQWDRPAGTVLGHMRANGFGWRIHPDQPRALTLAERALLQGFPSHWRWCGTGPQIAVQIGNAVPLPLARSLARLLTDAARWVDGRELTPSGPAC